jgi:hypothetical protein
MNPSIPYWPWGTPAVGKVTFVKSPEAGVVITIDGVDYALNADGSDERFNARDEYEAAVALAAAVNGDSGQISKAPNSKNPVKKVFAIHYGNVVAIVARVPGISGNDIAMSVAGAGTPATVTVDATLAGGADGQTIELTVGDVTIGTIKLEDGDSSAKLDIGSDGAGKNAAYVQAQALPLPTGASTEATLALIKAKTDNIDVALSTRTKPADQQHVIVDSTALAATAATAANQTTGNTSLSNIDTAIGAKADAHATTDAGTFSLIALFKRLLERITTIMTNGLATSKPAGTVVSSTALEKKHQLLGGPGTLLKLAGYSNAATAQWIQLHDSLLAPAEDAVPIYTAKVLVGANFPFMDIEGLHFTNGIWVCNSEDPEKLDSNADDCFFHARVIAD